LSGSAKNAHRKKLTLVLDRGRLFSIAYGRKELVSIVT